MAHALDAWGVTTSEALVKALKRPDTGRDGKPMRIDLLFEAWNDKSMYIPKKTELLVDAAIETLSQSAKPKTSKPYHLNPRYWEFLQEALPHDASDLLHGLAGKYHFLQLTSHVLSDADASLWATAAPVLARIVRAGVRRHGAIHVDAVNACFVDVFRSLPRLCEATQVGVTAKFLTAMLEYWRPALELGSNAKKTSKFFVQESLDAFASAWVHVEALDASELRTLLMDLSESSLFGPPTLSGGREMQPILDTVGALTTRLVERLSHTMVVVAALPCFLAQLVHALRSAGEASALSAAQRHSVLELYIVPVCTAMHSCLHQASFACAATTARLALVRQIDVLALFQPGADDTVWAALWVQFCTDTIAYMRTHERTSTCYATLSALWAVYSDSIAPQLVTMLAETAYATGASRNAAQDLIRLVLDHHAQLREMPSMVEMARDVIERIVTTADEGTRLVRSPFFCRVTSELWESRLRGATSHNQAAPLLRDTLQMAQACLDASIPQFLCMAQILVLVTKSVGLNQTADLFPDLAAIAQLADRCTESGLQPSGPRCIAASALRLRFVLMRRMLHHTLALDEALPDVVAQHMLGDMRPYMDTTEPELAVEALRSTLGLMELRQVHNQQDNETKVLLVAMVEGPLLPLLQQPVPDPLPAWDGQVFGMPASVLPVALWRLLTTRWVAVLDSLEPAQLVPLVGHLEATLRDPASCQAQLSRAVVRNAQFLEQPHWRTALLDYVLHATSWIDTVQPPSELLQSDSLRRALASMALLEALPISHLPRSSLDVLLPRLSWLDAALTIRPSVSSLPLKQVLYRASSTVHTLPQILPVPKYLEALCRIPSPDLTFVQASMDLLRAMLHRGAHDMTQLLPCLTKLDLRTEMAQQAFTTVVEWLAEAQYELSAQGCAPLLQAASLPAIGDNWSEAAVRRTAMRVRAFAALVRLCKASDPRTAGPDAKASAQLVEAVDALRTALRCRTLSSRSAAPLADAVFSALLALHPIGSPAASYVTLSVVFATLFCLLEEPGSASSSSLLTQYTTLVTHMDGDAYAHTLRVIETAFAGSNAAKAAVAYDTHEQAALLTLLAILLQHGPSGTSRIASTHFSSLLARLPLALHHAPRLAGPMVALLDRVCSNRALILRPLDVPRIFALVSCIVGPSGREDRTEDCTEAAALFSGIVSTLHAIIRLRKDLLGAFLPQLTEVLCLLLPLLQSLQRSNVGRTQLHRLAAATPIWLDVASHPLGAGEARALSRLYAEVPAKSTSIATIVAHKRRRVSTDEHTGTTESLARSMSKHAVYILVAYVRCVTQSGTTLATPVRQELQPGLYALCDLVSKYERDAVLKGMLDASGQIIFKALWSEWERQRYKGT
ncbi:hypothetical protein CBS9595_000937 [Malassezia furfur]|nr:hypothetical protein CBS9595_000937 [Malassezia furfur]